VQLQSEDAAVTEAPRIQSPAIAGAATAGSLLGGIAVGALLGYALCPGEAGAIIGGAGFAVTFGTGYGMWSAYALAHAHASLFRLLFLPWLRRREINRDREAWRSEFAAMWAKAQRKSFLFWWTALWVGARAAIALVGCALVRAPLLAGAGLYAAILAYGVLLARLARRGYLALPDE
jgi:hypothetical protein